MREKREIDLHVRFHLQRILNLQNPEEKKRREEKKKEEKNDEKYG